MEFGRKVLGREIEKLLCVSLAVIGFNLKFCYAIDHSYINLIHTSYNQRSALRVKLKKTGATRNRLEIEVEEGKNKA